MIPKSPEEYFQEQNFSADALPVSTPGTYSSAEKAFMEKYMGLDAAETLKTIGMDSPGSVQNVSEDGVGLEQEETLDSMLRGAPELLMVGFFMGSQEYVVPTQAVQEVIRYSTPARLPAAPSFVAGVINLRGRVTPLIRLKELLSVVSDDNIQNQFIIVCRRKGLQFGLMIDKVHTMYRVSQTDIEWGIETHLGGNVDMISGLLKIGGELVGIVSVDEVVDVILQN